MGHDTACDRDPEPTDPTAPNVVLFRPRRQLPLCGTTSAMREASPAGVAHGRGDGTLP